MFIFLVDELNYVNFVFYFNYLIVYYNIIFLVAHLIFSFLQIFLNIIVSL